MNTVQPFFASNVSLTKTSPKKVKQLIFQQKNSIRFGSSESSAPGVSMKVAILSALLVLGTSFVSIKTLIGIHNDRVAEQEAESSLSNDFQK